MIPPIDVLVEESFDKGNFILVCMAIPVILLLFSGVLGLVIKKLGENKEKGIFWGLIYDELVFSTFIRISNVFGFNLIYNSIQLSILLTN